MCKGFTDQLDNNENPGWNEKGGETYHHIDKLSFPFDPTRS